MKRILVFLITNALWLSAFMPAPGKGQAALGKQGPSPQPAPSVRSGASMAATPLTGAVAIHQQDNPTTFPATVGGAIENYEYHNKPFNHIPGASSSLRSYNNAVGQFNISDGYLNVLRLREHNWRDTWKMIIPGNFGDFESDKPDNWTDLRQSSAGESGGTARLHFEWACSASSSRPG
jgi:hypothetical protein